MGMLHFISPPMPHYTVSGEDTYSVGRKHPDRSNIGVFDLIVVTKGELIIEEANTVYQITANKYIILRPDLAHHTVAPAKRRPTFIGFTFKQKAGGASLQKSILLPNRNMTIRMLLSKPSPSISRNLESFSP